VALAVSDADYLTIQSVNSQVNADHDYETDQSGYGVGENWAIMGPGDRGDCEDFALTKMQALIDAGWDVSNLQMAWGQTETGGNHAFLIIQTSNRGTLVLDNRFENVRQIDNVPYRFQAFQAAGQSWSSYTAQLTGVTIEYMSCNSLAFADGDSVIVEFTGQSWASPKVVGFKANPAACSQNIFSFGGMQSYDESDWKIPAKNPQNSFMYSPETDTITVIAGPPDTFVLDGSYTIQATMRAHIVANSNESELSWIFGGIIYEHMYIQGPPATRSIYVIDWVDEINKTTEIWTTKTSFPSPARSWSKGFYIGGYNYLVGGTAYQTDENPNEPAGIYDIYGDFDRFDPVADTWLSKSDVPGTCAHGSFRIGGKGYIAGGVTGDYSPGPANLTSVVREFDPDADSWDIKTSMGEARYGVNGAHSIPYNRGYAYGGPSVANPLGDGALFEFDADLNTWTAKRDAPGDYAGLGGGYACGAANGLFIQTQPDLDHLEDRFVKWDRETDAYSSVAGTGALVAAWGACMVT